MNKSLRRRVAAVATTATVGGLLLPFLAAGSALAAPPLPATLTASPSNANSVIGGTPVFTVKVANPVAGSAVVGAVTSGPDIAATFGCVANGAATVYTCTSTALTTAGSDTLRFSYGTGAAYAAGNPYTTANLTVAGPLSTFAVSPTTASAAAGSYTAYSVSAADSAGRPITGLKLNATASQSNTSSGDLSLVVPKPANNYLPGGATLPAPSTSASAASPVFPLANSLVTGDGTGGTVAGIATFYLASKNPGTTAAPAPVTFSVTTAAVTGYAASGSLTVNAGLANDAATVTVSPTAQRAFTSDAVTAVVNVKNAQGNPIGGLPAAYLVTGTNAMSAPGNTGATVTDGQGNVTVTYAAGATTGSDTLTAWVDQSKNATTSPNRDSGEPFQAASVTLVPTDVTSAQISSSAATQSLPLSSKSTTVTYTVAGSGSTNAGYNVLFTPNPTQGTFTLSTPSAVTDASGNVSVTVTNANPNDADAVSVTATIGARTTAPVAPSKTVSLSYSVSAVSNATIKITPSANTTTALGMTSFTASATDQFGATPSGVSFDWAVTGGRNSATSTSGANNTTFGYTDTATTAATMDTVTVTARNGSTQLGSAVAHQYWISTAVTATQANIDLGTAGVYSPSSPYVASNFKTTVSAPVTADPVVNGTAPVPQKVLVKLADGANNRLYGKSVSFTSSGVGVFSDSAGKPLGTSATALVTDTSSASTTVDDATVFVRSTQVGTQTITATVDGINTTATVTYTGQFVGVTPVRAMDTRTGQGGLTTGTTGTGSTAPAGPLAPNTPYTLNFASAGIPLNQAAYAFNVTAVHPGGLGNLRVAPFVAGAGAPTTSLINYQSGSDVANFVVVPNAVIAGVGGAPATYSNALQLYSAASSADVTVDFVGSYPTAGSVSTITPSRIADTRSGAGPVAVGETRSFQVAGQGSIPASGAKAVALNVTAVSPGGLGNLRIFADGDAVPTTSNINFIPGQDKSAFVIVNLPANGKIDVFSAGSPVDVAIDAYASFDKGSSNVVTQTPVRILDTRPGNTLPVTHYLDLQVTGNAGVPANAQAVLVSVTGIHTTGSTGVGNLRVYPSGTALPTISTLNYVSPTSDVANFAIVPIGANGKISIDSEGSPTDVTVDVLGYVPAGS